MPRIVPLQLLGCLKVLLDENGGIKSSNDVKRLAGLMTKYSKKLVSKCVYVQILKSTKTELLEEFMSVGGWGLVYTWLNESMRSANWPLVQELLELLLLCPVDVNRLKINSAPKLVKELCREGGNEHVKILARRLVEQWLKIVTGSSSDNFTKSTTKSGSPTLPRVAVNTIEHSQESAGVITSDNINSVQIAVKKSTNKLNNSLPEYEKVVENNTSTEKSVEEQDPLADVGVTVEAPSSYSLTRAQKKAKEEGLVYKIIVRNGQQVLAKVAKTQPSKAKNMSYNPDNENIPDENINTEAEKEALNSNSTSHSEKQERDNSIDENNELPETNSKVKIAMSEDEFKNKRSRNALQTKNRKISDSSNSSVEDEAKSKIISTGKTTTTKEHEIISSEETRNNEKKEHLLKSDQKAGRDNKERETDRSRSDKHRDRDKEKHRKVSSSSSHKLSSSSNKSSSKGSSTSRTKSSSTSHRSSIDKSRHEKERSGSASKDKDRRDGSNSNNNLSSPALNKYRTLKSSSKEHQSSSHSSKDREKREKDRSVIDLGKHSLKKDKEKNEKDLKASSENQKTKYELNEIADSGASLKSSSTSITIPSKKASISIETRRDAEKVAAVKTYKAQFRSHGLTEEAPPPPSRKGLKKPSSSTPSAPGTSIPHSISLSATLKRPSPPPSGSGTPLEKKPKIDISALSVSSNDKPGAIKLIPAKRIQTLVETNLFSDALSAATGPKKPMKRKRLATSTQITSSKEGSSPPVSPEVSKLAPLKFYQDTLDENKIEEKTDKENIEVISNQTNAGEDKTDDNITPPVVLTDDDDDTPLKKVKESIQLRVLQEQKAASDAAKNDTSGNKEATSEKESNKDNCIIASSDHADTIKKPGPGCGPNGPPGVLMLHRRTGPKKKLSWRPPEHLEQIRYFELDENERVNVTKVTFNDMKNMERFSERDAINIARRGFNMDDKMQPQTNWRPLIEVDDVPEHPNGNQSKQRKIQAEREMTTLRALYFSHAMIPDSPAEAELEPHYAHDVPIIPLEDITGNPDAVNDFTSMPWPEPKGSPPRHSEGLLSGSGGLSGLDSTHDMFGSSSGVTPLSSSGVSNSGAFNPFNPFGVSMANMQGQHQKQHMQITSQPNGSPVWTGQINTSAISGMGPTPLMSTPFNGGPNHMPNAPSPNINMNMIGVHGPMLDNANPQNFMGGPQIGQFVPPGNYIQNGAQYPQQIFNGPNFGGPLGNASGGPRQLMNIEPMMNGLHNNNNNNGGKWRNNIKNFHGNSSGGVDNWRPAGPGSMRGDNGRGGRDSCNNNGVCKAFMRGHCRLGRSCKFIHPKSKRL